jgi:predicted metal-dependent hydrolase
MTPLDWSDGPLAAGLRCYQNKQFFDAHEHWESVWLKCEEPEKTFLQALIQITAAFHHLQKGNLVGTQSLLRAALRRLEGYPAEYSGVTIKPLRESVNLWLAALERADRPPQLPFPQIR